MKSPSQGVGLTPGFLYLYVSADEVLDDSLPQIYVAALRLLPWALTKLTKRITFDTRREGQGDNAERGSAPTIHD